MTDWGFFRHYWVVVKLVLTTPAIIAMLVHIEPARSARGDSNDVAGR